MTHVGSKIDRVVLDELVEITDEQWRMIETAFANIKRAATMPNFTTRNAPTFQQFQRACAHMQRAGERFREIGFSFRYTTRITNRCARTIEQIFEDQSRAEAAIAKIDNEMNNKGPR